MGGKSGGLTGDCEHGQGVGELVPMREKIIVEFIKEEQGIEGGT